MKKRIIKKYVNCFINPVIKDLPTTVYGVFEKDEEGNTVVIGRNHIIANGEFKQEGSKYYRCHDMIRNIKLSAARAKEVIEEYKEVYLRKFDIRGNVVYIRLITK